MGRHDLADQRAFAAGDRVFAVPDAVHVVSLTGPDALALLSALTTLSPEAAAWLAGPNAETGDANLAPAAANAPGPAPGLVDASRASAPATAAGPGAEARDGPEPAHALALDAQGHIMFGLTLAPARDGVLLLTDGDPASLAQYLNSRRFRRQALAAVLPDARVLIAPHLVLGAGTRDALGEAREDWPGQDTGVPNRAFGAEIGFLRGMRRKARTRGDSGAVGAGWQCREAPTREDDCGEFPARDTSSGVGWAPGTDPRFAGGTGEQDGAATQRLGGSLDTARADSTGTRHARSVPAGVDEQRGPEVQQVGNRTAGGSARPGNRPRYALTAEHPGHAWRGLALYPFDAAADRPLPRRLEAAGYREIDSAAVDALRVAAWRPLASLEAADGRTLPHELDWLRTTTPLNSGCYPGQETVAKIVNVGKPPRRLVFLHLDGSEAVLPEVGAPVWAAPHGAGAEVGRVTSVAMHFEDGPIALALVKRQVSADAVLLVTADAPGGAITASQVPIVPPSGESDSRPALRAAPRGLGLRRPRRG